MTSSTEPAVPVVARLTRYLAREKVVRAAPVALLLCVLGLACALRVRNIHESLPYCRHTDERVWVQVAWRMLRTGDPNPRRFTKPSLPVYTMAVAAEVGVLRARLRGEARTVADLGTGGEAYYRVPSAVEVMKWAFAAFSVAAIGLSGLVARRLGESRQLLWLAPLLTLISSSYFALSWRYMTVDIIGAFFIVLTVWHLLRLHQRAALGQAGGLRLRVALLGVFTGLAVGSKYNLFPLAVPCALGLWWLGPRRFLLHGAIYALGTIAAFVLSTPYAVFDTQSFMTDVLREVRHYASGHRGVEYRGFSAFVSYAGTIWQNWGLLLVFAGVGAVSLARRKPRELALVFAFPVCFLFYMSLQRVVFERNIVSLHLFIAIAVAVGLLQARTLCLGLLQRFRVPAANLLAFVLLAVVVLGALRWDALADAYAGEIESRNQAERWIFEHVPAKSILVVDRRLRMDERDLARRYEVVPYEANANGKRMLRRIEQRKRRVFGIFADTKSREASLEGAKRVASFGRGGSARSGDPRLWIARF